MTQTYTAQMSQRNGRWRLYVVIYGASQWPEYEFRRGLRVPTRAERSRALGGLGYAPTACEWQWSEDSKDPDDPASAVLLIAATTVEEVA